MKSKILLLLVATIWFACKKVNKQPVTKTTPTTENREEKQPSSDIKQDDVIIIEDHSFLNPYKGTVGDIHITMMLHFDGYKQWVGHYQYDKVGKDIDISGEINDDKKVVLTEFINEKPNGYFEFSLNDNSAISGQWFNKDRSKQLPFKIKLDQSADHDSPWVGNWHRNGLYSGGTITIGNVRSNQFHFSLDVFESGHMGFASGVAIIENNKAIFETNEYFEDEPCKLIFHLKENHIEVEQEGTASACGFGMRAYAAGKFENKKIKIKPVLTFGEEGDIFKTKSQHDAFKAMTGEDLYETFALNMQFIEPVNTNINNEKVVGASGAVSGLFTINEAIILHNGNNTFWAATITGEEDGTNLYVKYITNDDHHKTTLPKAIDEWRQRFDYYKVVFD